jgi:hypothetical protein
MPSKTVSSRFSWKRAVTPAGLHRLTIVICAVRSGLRTFVIVELRPRFSRGALRNACPDEEGPLIG